jgi:uncharacterized protein YuzE
MKITYFQDTDTLYIEFRAGTITESRDLDENTLIDLDAKGQICALTMEHARERADISICERHLAHHAPGLPGLLQHNGL